MVPTDRVSLSVVLRVVGGKPFVRRCLKSLADQVSNRPIEVIIPYDARFEDIGGLASEFPRFLFLYMPKTQASFSVSSPAAAHECCDQKTSVALAVARGEVVALIEDNAVPAHDWCDQILQAHKLPYEVIGGAVEHTGRGALNWAVYFLDFGRYQLPVSEGRVAYLTDVNVSYKRNALESVNAVWAQKYNEVAIHGALRKQGAVLWRRPQIVVYQDRGLLSFSRQLSERFAWGNLF